MTSSNEDYDVDSDGIYQYDHEYPNTANDLQDAAAAAKAVSSPDTAAAKTHPSSVKKETVHESNTAQERSIAAKADLNCEDMQELPGKTKVCTIMCMMGKDLAQAKNVYASISSHSQNATSTMVADTFDSSETFPSPPEDGVKYCLHTLSVYCPYVFCYVPA